MQKSIFFLLLLFITGTIACKKKKDATPPPPTTASDYMPMTTGSEWNYAVSTNGAPSTYKLTATAKDTLFSNGRTYKVFTNSSGPNEYYFRNGSEYYRYTTLPGLTDQSFELKYLVDNLNVGATWVETKSVDVDLSSLMIPGVGTETLPIQITFKIEEKGISHTVDAKTYSDVIRVSATLKITDSPFGEIVPSPNNINYYFAKGIGMVHNTIVFGVALAGIDVNSETKLTSYTIK
ncbi:MAG: hypothetical protein ACOVP6_06750 [Lacibacter sp.]